MESIKKPASALASLLGLIKVMRPKQWAKNAFVVAPLIFSGEFLQSDAILNALWATMLFCLAASSCYIINDIHDIDRDRRHPKKSLTRPLASGIISIRSAVALLMLLYGILIAASFFNPLLSLVIAGYIVLNIAYTFILKHEPVVDIFTIAIGFVLRVCAGAVALALPVSEWMFVTTLCLALYLASIKRRQEILQSGTDSREVLKKYSVALIDRYAEISATGALVFYSLFVLSAKPAMVITIPLVLFGIFRYWYIAEKLDGGESPTNALFTDWQLLLTIAIWIASCLWILWPH